MNRDSWTIICLAYVIGLLSTSILGLINPNPSWQQWIILIAGLTVLSLVSALWIPRFLSRGSRKGIWLFAGIIALLAAIYFQLRIPQPSVNDISYLIPLDHSSNQSVTVQGKVLSQAKVTRNQRLQLWLKAEQVESDLEVTGKLYVTLPLLKNINIYPSQELIIKGILYQPQAALNPGSFDFKKYLARQGAFAGLKGENVQIKSEHHNLSWSLWLLRQRIVAAQTRWINRLEGLLISSIVLGQRAVDLPPEIRDQFIKVGLAHVLAASGFHVSLLLGLVIGITRSLRARSQLIIGVIVLLIYLGLTGIQPSVLRAALMGFAALIALVTDRKVRPLGSLLLAATLLLMINPLWIWDLGFQLSFLATLGLMVTMPVLQAKLDWLPSAIAISIATPIAASLWTLPLLIYVFNTLAIYSIFVNIITAPLTLIISIGGMISTGIALIYPLAGSAIALLLYYPTHLLIETVYFFNQLPGNSLAIGKIPLGVMLIVYALIGLVWLSQWGQIRWRFVSLFAIALIVIPILYTQFNLVQVTVLSTTKEPILAIQDRGKVILINSGDKNTAKYAILPFLSLQGINHIDTAITFDSTPQSDEGLTEIQKTVSIKQIFTHLTTASLIKAQPLNPNRPLFVGSTRLMLLGVNPPLLQFKIKGINWLILPKSLWNKNIPKTFSQALEKYPIDFAKSQVILWSGRYLRQEWLRVIEPQSAIAFSRYVHENTQKQLKKRQIELYWTGRDGAIQWTSQKGFQTTISNEEQTESYF